MKRRVLRFLSWGLFLLICSGPVADEAERDGILKRGGQE